MAERSNATVLKTADGATRPGVRIPHHPPQKQNAPLGILFLSRMVRDKEPRDRGSTMSKRKQVLRSLSANECRATGTFMCRVSESRTKQTNPQMNN